MLSKAAVWQPATELCGQVMKIGYARVSTDEQSPDLQFDALRLAGCDRIFVDHASGARISRPALDKALACLNPGDTFITWKLDRLGRSLSHLIELMTAMESRGVAFRSLSEAIDTATPSGRLLFHVMGALAEFERALISERTRAGLAAARARGASVGRPTKLSQDEVEAARSILSSATRKVTELAAMLSVSPTTLRRAVRRRR